MKLAPSPAVRRSRLAGGDRNSVLGDRTLRRRARHRNADRQAVATHGSLGGLERRGNRSARSAASANGAGHPDTRHAEQVYACLWSHSGWKPVHIHFVLQPSWSGLRDRFPDPGPFLQVSMFQVGERLHPRAVEEFCDRARRAFQTQPSTSMAKTSRMKAQARASRTPDLPCSSKPRNLTVQRTHCGAPPIAKFGNSRIVVCQRYRGSSASDRDVLQRPCPTALPPDHG